MELLCWVSWVHYQSIPGEKPFDINSSDIFTLYARLTAQLINIIMFKYIIEKQAILKYLPLLSPYVLTGQR